jgi:hypothetical protein
MSEWMELRKIAYTLFPESLSGKEMSDIVNIRFKGIEYAVSKFILVEDEYTLYDETGRELVKINRTDLISEISRKRNPNYVPLGKRLK